MPFLLSKTIVSPPNADCAACIHSSVIIFTISSFNFGTNTIFTISSASVDDHSLQGVKLIIKHGESKSYQADTMKQV